MSFLKITDPTKIDQTVKEYLEFKKNIWDNLLSERAVEQQLQTELQKPQQERLPKDLDLLEKVLRICHKLYNLLVKHQEEQEKYKTILRKSLRKKKRGRQEARESFWRLVEKNNTRG